jgi:DNA-binding HxlR family transcriptional regulator
MKRKVTRITESKPSASDPATLCPVGRAAAVVGDRWTVLILRELFSESHRFEEIQAQSGATPQMVAARLKALEADGIVERRIYNERPLRHDYHLTKKGEALFPVFLALRAWGETWLKAPKDGWTVNWIHRTGDFNPPYQAERDNRWAAFKQNRGASR